MASIGRLRAERGSLAAGVKACFFLHWPNTRRLRGRMPQQHEKLLLRLSLRATPILYYHAREMPCVLSGRCMRAFILKYEVGHDATRDGLQDDDREGR